VGKPNGLMMDIIIHKSGNAPSDYCMVRKHEDGIVFLLQTCAFVCTQKPQHTNHALATLPPSTDGEADKHALLL